MPWKDRPLLLVCAILLALVTLPLTYTPHRISLKITGSSNLRIPADRAVLSLKISSTGTRQHKVADDIRKTTDEILNLLRPLSLPSNSTSTNTTQLPPIARLSVNTYSSYSGSRPAIIGETTTYSTSISVTAEFRSTLNATSDQTGLLCPDFHHLSLVLPTIAKLPRTRIDELRWFLSPDRLSSAQSEARQKAVSDALRKISDFVAPMKLKFPAMRCMSFHESASERSSQRSREPRFNYRRDGIQYLMDAPGIVHDELDAIAYDEASVGLYGYDIEQQDLDTFGLEPQYIEVSSTVDGDWTVVERDFVRTVLGILF